MSEKKITFFAAACFFLSAIEYALPRPVPFFRLGLANLPIMLSFAVMSKKESIILVLFKILSQSFISGTLFSYIFVFSFLGTTCSALAMGLCYNTLKKRRLISWIGISAIGGFANNAAQLFASYIFIFGKNTRLIAPAMLLISLISSVCLGVFACFFEKKSRFLEILKVSHENQVFQNEKIENDQNHISIPLFFLAIAAFLIIFFAKSLWIVYTLAVFFAILVFIKKRKIKLLPSVILIASITVFSLLTPFGKVLFSLGNFRITQGALEVGLLKAGRLCAMAFASQFLLSNKIYLPGKIGSFFSKTTEILSNLMQYHPKIKLGTVISTLDGILVKEWCAK